MREKSTGLAGKPTVDPSQAILVGRVCIDSRRHPARSSIGPGKTTDPHARRTNSKHTHTHTTRRGGATRPPRSPPRSRSHSLRRSLAVRRPDTPRVPVAHHTRTRALLDQASTRQSARAPRLRARATSLHGDGHLAPAHAGASDHSPRGGGRVGRCSLTVPAAAGASASSPGLAPDTGAPAWDALGGVSVLVAETGSAVALTDLWDSTEGVAVVALLRHFGCFCCWELASVLKDSMAKFDSAGAKLIAIGVGTPEKARILADRLPFPMDSLYADPERKAYNVLGLYHGLGRTLFSPASAKIYSRLDYIKEATKNYTLEATPADLTGVLQQGGMFVFRGKELLYSWRDEGTGDHAPLDDVLSACRKIPVA